MLPAIAAFTGLSAGLLALNKLYFRGTACLLPGRLDGKVAVVTGANSGIGRETTAELARRGAKVIMACRDEKRALFAKQEILKCYGEESLVALKINVASDELRQYITTVKPDQLIIEELDLSSLDSIRAFATRVCQPDARIDYLINNAGVMACPYSETKDGFEMQIGTNYLGHFLLTELLLPAIKRAAPGSRIINVSSLAHYKGKINFDDLNLRGSNYGRIIAYRQSKLANAIHAHELSKRLKEEGIITASLHPGVVATELLRTTKLVTIPVKILGRPFCKTPWEGAQTTLYTILAKDLKSGGYYADCAPVAPNPLVYDEETGSKLWKVSSKYVGLS